MNINLRIRLSALVGTAPEHNSVPWLCFRHAVKRAQSGQEILVDIDDYDSEHYLGRTTCTDCEGMG